MSNDADFEHFNLEAFLFIKQKSKSLGWGGESQLNLKQKCFLSVEGRSKLAQHSSPLREQSAQSHPHPQTNYINLLCTIQDPIIRSSISVWHRLIIPLLQLKHHSERNRCNSSQPVRSEDNGRAIYKSQRGKRNVQENSADPQETTTALLQFFSAVFPHF